MKLVHLLLSFLFLYGEIDITLAQIKKREGLSLGEKYNYLIAKSLRKSIIKINAGNFKEFVKFSPKNYSVVIMFTAMAPQRMCVICGAAYDEYKILVNSYRYSPGFNEKLFFGAVDFDEGPEVFNMMRLNAAPTFIHFPPKGKPKPADLMDIQRVGFSAEAMAKWIADRTDVQIRIFRPPNYSGAIGFFLALCIISSFLYLWRNNLDISKLKSKTLWGTLAVIFTLCMVSGQMWNHIRSPPFIHKGQNGIFSYVHGSSQAQFVLETYIVIILDGLIILGIILMTEAGQKKGDVKKRRALAVTGLFFFVVFFSFLLLIFRTKAHGYPYSLLFK